MASAGELSKLVQRLEVVATRLESAVDVKFSSSAPAVVEEVEEVSAVIMAFDDIVSGPFAVYLDTSKKIGGDVATQAEMVQAGFKAQREFLQLASRCKAPAMDEMVKVLGPTSEAIQSVQSFREKKRTSPHFNHLSAISESIPALGWVTIAPAPGPYVKEMNDAGQFYTNRVLKEFKDKDKTHVDWVRAWIQVLVELQAFIKEHHTTGLTWNAKGGDAMQCKSRGSAQAPPPAGPAPPPMPMGDLFADVNSGAEAADGQKSRAELFAQLNLGSDVTKGLKKVTPDMQTHKNPTLRGSDVVRTPGAGTISTCWNSGKSVSAHVNVTVTNKPPKMELDGKKWLVEYQKNQTNLLITDTEMRQNVYVFKCEGSTIQVKGKVNSITLDSCKKTSVVLDSVVSAVEFINCQSVQMQVLTKVPTISIDKTDGCQIYLNSGSLDVSIVSAKSSEMNVLVPKADGDFVEYPIPEQFKTTYNGKGLTTVITESA
uniref:EOG090X08PR n=1 Tax=Evadne anonyx TaxID=141404 RepID=A0A9N6WT24_9CRUS|nr:EOG090X08PR [Evadne anonyx]